MSNPALERLIWVLIYAGLLTCCLGLFIGRHDRNFGWAVGLAGAAAALVGAILIVVRARRAP